MSVPLTADQFVAALRAEGLRVIEVGSWRTHNRNHKGPWGPVHGIIHHHTASSGTAGSVELCRAGHSTLPGPLCHGVIDKTGTVHLVGYGRTNHAGGGDPNVLQAVIDEQYGDRPPVPRVGNDDGIDGNRHFYGFECINLGDGKDPWPAIQVDAMVRSSAALSRAHRWMEKSSIAHREWSDDKPDPAGPGMPSMPVFRERIKERLAHAPSWSPTAPVPPTPQGPNMTAPFRTFLSRDQDVTLLQDIPHTIYWTNEHADTGNEHGDGGKTLITAGQYSGVVNLTLDGLKAGEHVEVYPIEEDTSGVTLGAGFKHMVRGWGDGSLPAVEETVALNGSVGQRLCVQVVSRSETPVTLKQAWLSIQHWN